MARQPRLDEVVLTYTLSHDQDPFAGAHAFQKFAEGQFIVAKVFLFLKGQH